MAVFNFKPSLKMHVNFKDFWVADYDESAIKIRKFKIPEEILKIKKYIYTYTFLSIYIYIFFFNIYEF